MAFGYVGELKKRKELCKKGERDERPKGKAIK